jgi:glycerol kinase
MPSNILVLDQGTTGSTAALFEAETLTLIATHKVEFSQHFPQPGWVEHDPQEIWNSIITAIQLTLSSAEKAGISAPEQSIACIGITNQRESIVPLCKESGATPARALVWQDRRTAARCEELKQDTATASYITENTGLVIDPYFSATKMEWLLTQQSEVARDAQRGTLGFATIDSFMIYKMTGGKKFVTEHSNASRTLLYNLKTRSYDRELLKVFGIAENMLPEILASDDHFGTTLSVPGLPDGIPITGVLGDQQAALFGHGGTQIGLGKITYGTGAFLLVQSGATPIVPGEGLLSTVAYVLKEHQEVGYAFEGSAFIAGAAIQYIRDNFSWITHASEIEALAQHDSRDPEVAFIPAFAGLGAPYWNPHARAALFGLSRGTSKSQICRAVLESIALQNVAILALMQKHLPAPIKGFGVDGGAAKSNYLMQFQSDTTRLPLTRGSHTEMTAYGAARMARRAIIKRALPVSAENGARTFTPTMTEQESSSIVAYWQRAARLCDALGRNKR